MIKKIPLVLNSYDILKTFAVVTMIIDHIGANFYPDDQWWRVVGRMSVPVWLFLVGYAKSRDMSPVLWAGTLVLLVANFVVGQAILPLCILGTIIASRFAIDPIMGFVQLNKKRLYPIVAIAFVLTIPMAGVLDYGASVFLFAMLGYMVRNHEDHHYSKYDIAQFATITVFCHGFLQVFAFFSFDDTQKILAGAGMLAVTFALTRFRYVDFVKFDEKAPFFVSGFFKLCGRKSLEIYVIHLLIFKVLALCLGIKGFGLFDLHIF